MDAPSADNQVDAADPPPESVALTVPDGAPLISSLQAERMLIRLDELEDRFYHFIEYLEAFGEDDFLTSLNGMRDSLRTRRLSYADMTGLERIIGSLQFWPQQLGDAMETVRLESVVAAEQQVIGY